MLLGFKEQYEGAPTNFVQKILAGLPKNAHMKTGRDFKDFQTDYWKGIHDYRDRPKIHTIRHVTDPKRWPSGRSIQYAIGVRTKHCRVFAEGTCAGTQDIVFRIGPNSGRLLVAIGDHGLRNFTTLDEEGLLRLALNDGFDTWAAFEAWFRPLTVTEGGRMDRTLIHWTDLRY